MFEKLLKFFIKNSRINYLLFVLVFVVGSYSYIKSPKEIFPSFSLDMIGVYGGYVGTSIDMLDKMAVKDIEEEVKSIDGIKNMTTIINPGRFNIILELEKRVDKYATSELVKDAIANASQNLPSDMNTPTVNILAIEKDLLSIAISSSKLDHEALVERAKSIKDKINNIKNISKVTIYGDSDKYYDVIVNRKKIDALGLNQAATLAAISKLSYIYPLGKVEDSKKGFFYISTYNGPKDAQNMLNTKLRVSNTTIYLKDIATVKKRNLDSATLFSLNNSEAVDIVVKQSPKGNAITLAKKIHTLIDEMKKDQKSIVYQIHNDNSVHIKDRLNIIVSNILLGIILITLLMSWLINSRLALIIALGIPTSFVMGAFFLYVLGYSINMILLVGVLIALGIIVDDAIVVSENIQQHIEDGLPPKEAAILGAKEMAEPVTIASFTTMFAFLPALMMSGTMGEVIKLIPIAVSILLITSLIESFIFLPIHAAHILKKEATTRSWVKANRIYSKIIHLLMHYKKSFLATFIIIVPILTVMMLKMSKFQMFPTFDASVVTLTLKADVNSDTKDIHKILKKIESDLMEKKDEFDIKLIGSVAGWRRDSVGVSESYPYVGMSIIELQKLKPQNFVDKFITPNLSFYYDSKNRTRDEKSQILSKRLREFIKKQDYKKRYNLTDIDIAEVKVGPGKSDIKIGLVSDDDALVIEAIKELKEKLQSINGLVSITDATKFGVDELKLKINSYGESLGVDEQSLGIMLSNTYLEKKSSLAFDSTSILDIKIRSSDKDSLDALKNYELTLQSGDRVLLKDVVEFKKRKSFEKVMKDFGVKNFYIYANVDSTIITPTDAVNQVAPLLDKFRSKGIKIKLKGEEEEKKDLKNDMMAASTLAMVLIMLSLLYLFNSFRETFMMMSVIPFSILGVLIGHRLLGLNLSMPSIIGILGLSGIVINDGIIMIMNLKKAKNMDEIYFYASKRFRPIILTSVTTLIGLSSLIFFPTGQAAIFQPMAIALGFGLAWGTVLNLLYLPALFSVINAKKLRHL
jgi:multidrug efflux pump subunit AcrB